MNRASLKFLAAVIGTFVVIVPFLGLDNLPRSLRAQIEPERRALVAAQSQLEAQRSEVAGDLQSESDLFRAVPASSDWPDQLSRDAIDLASASRDMAQITALEKQNRRQDREQVERLLAHERDLRTKASTQAAGIQKEAAHWVDLKRHLPDTLQQMSQDYSTIRGFDLGPLTSELQTVETDWPDKKADLEGRLGNLREAISNSQTVWQSTAEERREAAAGNFAHLDFAGLVSGADTLKSTAAALPQQAEEIKSLSAQLYNSWDKILVDMEERDSKYDQKIRTVRTHLTDSSAKTGEITSDEQWTEVSKATYDSEKNDLGMAIAHKAAGKYDVEAERVAQPAGFAYVAPPTQGSNQYGYWDHRDGRDFWVFYGQYALLRDLLWNHQYVPVDRYDWEEYRTYHSRGQTYYGRDSTGGQSAPRYGTQGTSTQNRYSGSTFAKGGGFRNSQYASKSGSYGDSKYASPGGDRTPRRFGSSSQPHASPPPSRPAPRPSYRPSPPRRFGRR